VLFPYPAQPIYELVLDIERYPEFLPWVAGATVLERFDDHLTAELVADLKGFRQAFQTVDRFAPHQIIEIRLLNGPFKFLEAVWTFTPKGEGTMVHFSIAFEFSSRLLSMTAGPLFLKAAQMMVDEFLQRARLTLGPVSHPPS